VVTITGAILLAAAVLSACDATAPTPSSILTAASATSPVGTSGPIPSPETVCGPPPPPDRVSGLPYLTCSGAIAAALAQLTFDHAPVVRIEFGFGSYCGEPASCGGPDNLIGGFVVVQYADDQSTLVSVIANTPDLAVSVTGVTPLTPEAPLPSPPLRADITFSNRSSLAVVVFFTTDIGADSVGLPAGERATVTMPLASADNGVNVVVLSPDCQRIATASFPTPQWIDVVIADGSTTGTLMLSAVAARGTIPLPEPSSDHPCLGE